MTDDELPERARPRRAVVGEWTDDGLPRLPGWLALAACRKSAYDFATADLHPNSKDARKLKAVCRGCEVVDLCLIYAMSHEGTWPASWRVGVFGGLTPSERHHLARYEGTRTTAV